MLSTSICNIVFPVGRITPNGVELLGTAFLINKKGFFATAAHVVGNNDNDLVIIRNRITSIQDYQDVSDKHISEYAQAKIKEINPIADVCILETPLNILSLFSLASTDSVCVGEQISIFGYPHSNHGRMVLTQQNASVGAKIMTKSNGIMLKNIILNFQSQPGQSGSPIIAPREKAITSLLIGSYAPNEAGNVIIAGIDPQTLHQTTHAISTEYIKEMLE